VKTDEFFLVNILTRFAMRRIFPSLAASLVIVFCSCNYVEKDIKSGNNQLSETIFPKGDKITNNNFIGNAWLEQMVMPDSSNPTQVGNVTFEKGARTKWHSHPGGQILLITGGTGYYQEKGSAKRLIKKGYVIKCPPNVPHWHGASKDDELIQIAVTNTQKGNPVWLDTVTDEEYNSQ
jgi:quercetin dioxygenase-like cupin family protein